MNDYTNQSGRRAQISLSQVAKPSRVALAVSMALMALSPQISYAGPGKVCLDGVSPASACASGLIGTYYANSPTLRKFVDTLPGLTAGNANKFAGTGKPGEYLPIAVADTTTYPGSEYFIIGVVEHAQWM